MSLRFACRACESNGNCAVICHRSYAPWRPTTQTYPGEERAAGRSPVRSTATQAAKQHRGAWCFTTQRLVLAIRMQSMREQWNLRRQMSQELCSVATNDARPIPASILLNTICVDDPRIPTLGIGGFCIRKTPR